MDNPFIYGESVVEGSFCDRKKELAMLSRDILNSQKIFLISQRRLGKTSLIKNTLAQLKKKEILTVFIDMEEFASYKEFLDAYLLELSRLTSPLDKLLAFIKQAIPGIRIDIKVGEDGSPTFSLGYEYPGTSFDKAAQKIYDLPELIAGKKKRKLVIVFDEFQEIVNLDGGKIEGKLRASIQHQRHVSYVFAGSKKHLLSNMVNSPDRPFYKIGPVMYLDKIPENDFTEFIKDKYKSGKINISEETIRKIIEKAGNIPYYIQMFSHELWDYAFSGKRVQDKDIDTIINQLIGQYSSNLHLEWSRLTLSKRQLLKAIAHSGGRGVLSKKFLKQHDLGLPSKIKKTLISLVDSGYLDRTEDEYQFNDQLLREWIKRQP